MESETIVLAKGVGGRKEMSGLSWDNSVDPSKTQVQAVIFPPNNNSKRNCLIKKKKSRLYPRQLEVLGPVKSITANNVYIPVDEHVQGKDGG